MHLHDFLSQAHLILKPRVYLEVGVQHGYSLARAHAAQVAIGIDPEPLIQSTGNQNIYTTTSNKYFSGWPAGPEPGLHLPIDFAFIDGLHHAEQALEDFLNIEKHCHRGSVVIFDDVLPRNQAEASREQCPGDWTGDVWKIPGILLRYRPELHITEVNTTPTGTLMVRNFKSKSTRWAQEPRHLLEVAKVEYVERLTIVPDDVINRDYAVDPDIALNWLREWHEGLDEK